MLTKFKWLAAVGLIVGCLYSAGTTTTAVELIARMIDQTRGMSSYSELRMTIKRPDWQRTSAFSVWTRGREDALIRFTAPIKDAGNATLKVGDKMWTYSTKIRRSIRLPKSMMSQEWAGSDFSYNDLARSDKLLVYYDHEIVQEDQEGDLTLYTIDSRPKENAPVVWGLERTVFRSDNVLLSQVFYDQNLEVVKSLQAFDIKEIDGRMLATRMRMSTVAKPDSWTEVLYEDIDFDIDVDDRLFTQFALRGGD